MRKIIILIPVFNDWESLKKLINEISKCIIKMNDVSVDCLIINDASTITQPEFVKPSQFNSLKILNMKENKGHARCNAFGIRYVNNNFDFDNLILMDGDGEDRPEELEKLINKAMDFPNNSIVAKRVKRSEGFFFQFLYFIHKFITLLFTGKKINFGNYSCLTKKDVNIISDQSSLWSSYSGTLKKKIDNLKDVDSIRGLRYFGPSKMSLFKLIIHSLSIIAVFKHQVFFRSVILILVLNLLKTYLGLFSVLVQVFLVFFILTILIVSFREKSEDLLNSQKNLKNIQNITH